MNTFIAQCVQYLICSLADVDDVCDQVAAQHVTQNRMD